MQAKTPHQTAVHMAIQMLPQDANPMGHVHGGVIMRYIDEAGGVAFLVGATPP